MRYLALILILGCTPKPVAEDFLPVQAVAVGIAEATNEQPAPAPTPKPGKCENCNGTGRLGDGTVSVDCPECVDGVVGQKPATPPIVEVKAPTSVNYVSEKEAVASGKVRFYHVTDSKTCAPCRLAKQFMSTPAFIAASEDFACVLIDRANVPFSQFQKWTNHYGVRLLPAEVFVSPDGKRKVAYNGLPHTAPATGNAYYLQILNIGREEVLGEYVKPLSPTALKNVVQKNLIPTLAASNPPRTQTVVEGPPRSVVVVRTPPAQVTRLARAAGPTARGCVHRDSTG